MNRVGKSSDIAHLGVDTMGVFFLERESYIS